MLCGFVKFIKILKYMVWYSFIYSNKFAISKSYIVKSDECIS